jgi:hypothetical protein
VIHRLPEEDLVLGICFTLELLETRRLLAGDVLSYHNDPGSTGQNLTEVVLRPANVTAATFGKRFTTTLDGQVYAQPLYKANVNITRANQGVHNVVYAVTQHDSLYAIDANSGTILWQDSFLNITDPTNLTPTAGVSTMGAVSGNSDTAGSTLITPEIGITSTPVIDPATNIIYLVAKTKEFRNGSTPAVGGADRHYVQRLWAINMSSGAPALAGPALIGDTVKNTTISNPSGDAAQVAAYNDYQYFAGPIVNGTGNNGTVDHSGSPVNVTDGWIPSTDPAHLGYDPDASGQIAFNALLHLNRVALTLLNGKVYIGFASHGDRGPYYGWILSYSASTLALTGAIVTAPTFHGVFGNTIYTAQGGVWMSGAKFASDGNFLYCTTGNGAFNDANANFDANGFPLDHNYSDCLIKIGEDPASSPANQNGNGWGIKVYDYFCPSNQANLNDIDADVGASGVTLLPDNAGNIAGHPHLLVLGGKEGRIYLIDRDNLGKFNLSYPKGVLTAPYPDPRDYDRVVGEYLGNPINTDPNRTNDTATYFNGRIYLHLSGRQAWAFNVSSFATGSVPPGSATVPAPFQTTSATFGNPGGTQSLSANGNSNGIVWVLRDAGASSDKLTAYDASSYVGTIFDSGTTLTSAGGGTTGVKFVPPTVINGLVYCPTGGVNSADGTDGLGSIVVYGLLAPSLGTPTNLAALRSSATNIHLTWTDNAADETFYQVERSRNGGSSWTVLGFTPNGTPSFDDTTFAAGQQYLYRVKPINGPSSGSYSASAAVSTIAPGVTASSFTWQNFPQRLNFTFDQDVSASLSTADLQLQNLTTATAIPSASISMTWDAPTKTATFTFSTQPSGALFDGNYQATLLSAGITNASNTPMASDYATAFFFLNGDANHDAIVDVSDLGILATNWQATSGKNYQLADFNYDGLVDVSDLGILATNWQKSVPATGPLAAATGASLTPPTPASALVSAAPFADGTTLRRASGSNLVQDLLS